MSKRPPAPRRRTLPGDVRAFELASLIQQAQGLFAAGQYGKAARAAEEACRRSPDEPAALIVLARIAHRTGATEVAANLYGRVLKADARNAAAHAGLGDVQASRRNWAAAVESFARATSLDPTQARYCAGLGAAQIALGRRDEAAASFRRAKAIDPNHKLASYMLDGLDGGGGAVQANYVRAMFDGYAHAFEKHLVETLQYRIPWVIADAVIALHPDPFAAALDLGCGTGLVGDALTAAQVPVIDGIDLSPRMIEETRKKGRYRSLHVDDIVQAMDRPEVRSAGYDLLVAADVFIYVGDLQAVFARAREVLPHGGLFAFSLEHGEADGFAIQASSRYAHGEGYTAGLAGQAGFVLATKRHVALRQESKVDIAGRIEIWRRS